MGLWQPPSSTALYLRAVMRAVEDLTSIQTHEKNREHALVASQALPSLLIREVKRHQRYLQSRLERLHREALRLVARDPKLNRRFQLMQTTPGIGENSALQILGELAVLPDTLDAREWVAFSGLDPRRFKSGTSVEQRPCISRAGSRHLGRALYMPALVVLRHDPYLRTFYQHLLKLGKARLQSVIAVMRTLLHAFFAMFKSDQPYDGSRLCPSELANKPVAFYG